MYYNKYKMKTSLNLEELEYIYNEYPEYRNMKNFIETYTYHGCICRLVSPYFEKVYTVDFDETNYNLTKELSTSFSNISFYLGNSEHFLEELIHSIMNDNNLFFLNSNYTEDIFPRLLNEIEIIVRHLTFSDKNNINIFIMKQSDVIDMSRISIFKIFKRYNINILNAGEHQDKYIILTY